MEIFFIFIVVLTQILTVAIIARALLSWFPIRPGNPFVILLDQITDPVLEPLRRVVPRIGIFDITPIIAILILQLIRNIAAGFVA